MDTSPNESSLALANTGQQPFEIGGEVTGAIASTLDFFSGEDGVSAVAKEAFKTIWEATEKFADGCCYNILSSRHGMREGVSADLKVKSGNSEQVINCIEVCPGGNCIKNFLGLRSSESAQTSRLIEDLIEGKKAPGPFPIESLLDSVIAVLKERGGRPDRSNLVDGLQVTQKYVSVSAEELIAMREEVEDFLKEPDVATLQTCAPRLFESITRLTPEAKKMLNVLDTNTDPKACSSSPSKQQVAELDALFVAVIQKLEKQTDLANEYLKVCDDQDKVSKRQAARKLRKFRAAKKELTESFQAHPHIKELLDMIPFFQKKEKARDDAMAKLPVEESPTPPVPSSGSEICDADNGQCGKETPDNGGGPTPGLF